MTHCPSLGGLECHSGKKGKHKGAAEMSDPTEAPSKESGMGWGGVRWDRVG